MFSIAAGALVAAYAVFALFRLGLHQRLPLALAPISLETIPDRAEAMHGNRIIFTTDTPVQWEVPVLKRRYPDPCAWSAARVRATAGHVARLLHDDLRLARGDRVAILKENHLDMHVLYAAVVRAGGVACAINGRFEAASVRPYLLNLGATVLISDSVTLRRILVENGRVDCVGTIVMAERRVPGNSVEAALTSACPGVRVLWLEEALAAAEPEYGPVARFKDDVLYLVHTSGTTGFPKAVILKNGAQSHAVRGWLCYVHIFERPRQGIAGRAQQPSSGHPHLQQPAALGRARPLDGRIRPRQLRRGGRHRRARARPLHRFLRVPDHLHADEGSAAQSTTSDACVSGAARRTRATK